MGIVQQLVEGLAALVEHVDEWWDEEAMPEQLLAELSTAPQRSSVSASAPLPSFPDGMPPEAAAVLQQQLLAMPQIEPAHFRVCGGGLAVSVPALLSSMPEGCAKLMPV